MGTGKLWFSVVVIRRTALGGLVRGAPTRSCRGRCGSPIESLVAVRVCGARCPSQ